VQTGRYTVVCRKDRYGYVHVETRVGVVQGPELNPSGPGKGVDSRQEAGRGRVWAEVARGARAMPD
jgi:hypothetical protein